VPPQVQEEGSLPVPNGLQVEGLRSPLLEGPHHLRGDSLLQTVGKAFALLCPKERCPGLEGKEGHAYQEPEPSHFPLPGQPLCHPDHLFGHHALILVSKSAH
jgi:hypothetical protein